MTRAGIKWTDERLARLGFLIGLGWFGDKVAADFGTTSENVYRQAKRFGLSFREAAWLRERDHFRKAAEKRGITLDELLMRLLAEIEADPVLIDNILDDDVSRAA
jgi:hypothetical protein